MSQDRFKEGFIRLTIGMISFVLVVLVVAALAQALISGIGDFNQAFSSTPVNATLADSINASGIFQFVVASVLLLTIIGLIVFRSQNLGKL